MAAGVTMPTPDTVIAKPSVGFAPEGATSIKAEDKVKQSTVVPVVHCSTISYISPCAYCFK